MDDAISAASVVEMLDVKFFRLRIALDAHDFRDLEPYRPREKRRLLFKRKNSRIFGTFFLFRAALRGRRILGGIRLSAFRMRIFSRKFFLESVGSFFVERSKINFCRAHAFQSGKFSQVFPRKSFHILSRKRLFTQGFSKIRHYFPRVLRKIRLEHYHDVLDDIAKIVDETLRLFRLGNAGFPRLRRLERLVANVRNFEYLMESVLEIRPFQIFGYLRLERAHLLPKFIVLRALENLSAIIFVHEKQRAVHQISEISHQFRIELFLKILPSELEVLAFRPIVENVESPCVGRNSAFDCVASEHADVAAFREFSVLVIEIFCGTHVEEFRPAAIRILARLASKQSAREDHGVERNVVLSDELEKLDIA